LVVNDKNKIETNLFLNHSRTNKGVITENIELSLDLDIYNSPHAIEKIGIFEDLYQDNADLGDFQYGYEEYGITYSDNINGFLNIGDSRWIKADKVSHLNWIALTYYGYANSPGLVLRTDPNLNSKKILTFQGESYQVNVISQKLINGYSEVSVDLYELDPCEGGSHIESWKGWAKIIDDNGYPNID